MTAASPAEDPGMLVVRWLDVVLVLLAAPFVLVAGLPVLGYVVGAVLWTLQRVAQGVIDRRARAQTDLRSTVGLQVAGIVGRGWLVALTILAVGLAAEREDGATAAVVVLAAFSVHLGMTLVLKSFESRGSTTA
ncbi:hypothetical protein [Conexibacter sp. SYSU D00693]|uniref:hypothetical protein n=1 Tax=Conexibacter sp. SYSU D00693 TaxID=2812560 RepID=UPI00196ACF4B|nr:hypothetical protein [Conexibacter sp. SYSU D00693]